MSRPYLKAPESYEQRQVQQQLDTIARELDQKKNIRDHTVHGIDSSLILRSANGHYWKISVDNAGVLSTTDLGTVIP